MAESFTDVACTVCGCVCDDLTVATENGRVVRADGACRLAEPWFLGQNTVSPSAAEIDGRPVPVEDAYARAGELLRGAKAPLIYGLTRTSTAGLRAAVALADRLGAAIDTTGDHAATVAFQQVGQSTCTLGDVRQRADLVVFWGCDPAATHPRFVERYCPPRPGRTLVVVGEAETETAKLADQLVRVTPGRHWEALTTLRLLAAGIEARPGCDTGASLDELRALAARIAGSRFGVVFFGDGLTRGPLGHRTAEALFQLVADRNDRGRFYAVRMRRNVSGADSVLAWQTGYPFGVDFGKSYPRSNPGETTGADRLARGEVDVCVLVGGDVAGLPDAALAHLRRIPVILLDEPGAASPVPAAVRFTTAVNGVHRPGTAHRIDDVTIPLRVLLPTEYPGDDEVLSRL